MRLEDVTVETFTPLVGDVFSTEIGGGERTELELLTASAAGASASGRARVPFSLSFAGPSSAPVGQGTYRLSHPATGPLEIFLVPIGRDETAATYEAVFT